MGLILKKKTMADLFFKKQLHCNHPFFFLHIDGNLTMSKVASLQHGQIVACSLEIYEILYRHRDLLVCITWQDWDVGVNYAFQYTRKVPAEVNRSCVVSCTQACEKITAAMAKPLLWMQPSQQCH